MIHRLANMVGSENARTGLSMQGRMIWVRAVPAPFYGGLFDRVRDAWAIVRGRAFAVQWPQAGEFEELVGPKI